MKSKTTHDFWKHFQQLPKKIKLQSVLAYKQWQENPFHASLHFKRVG